MNFLSKKCAKFADTHGKNPKKSKCKNTPSVYFKPIGAALVGIILLSLGICALMVAIAQPEGGAKLVLLVVLLGAGVLFNSQAL